MEKSYAKTKFLASEDVIWPKEFVIVSARAPTGEHWTERENEKADAALWRFLINRQGWLARVICTSPEAPSKEPSWAFQMPFEAACELGLTYRQEALFHVQGDDLSVSYCDERKELRRIGAFRERVDRF